MNECDKWNANYKEFRYSDVFSILDDRNVRKYFKKSIENAFQAKPADKLRVLIPGCGSNVSLQRLIFETCGANCRMTAIDWSEEALELAKLNSTEIRAVVDYKLADFTSAEFEESFDLVMVSNSVVSEDFERNCDAIRKFASLCDRGGMVAGTFPCAFGMFDYSLTSGLADHWRVDGTIDIEKRIVYEESQDMRQRFFTPLELRVACNDAGLELDSLEVLFYASPEFSNQVSKLYQIRYSERFCFWGMFLCSTKRGSL